MMFEQIDAVRPLSAARLLSIWQDSRELDDPLERSLLCNARVLADCCFSQGEPAFEDAHAVLEQLTARQMEVLLRRLSDESAPSPDTGNPAFDLERFRRLLEG